MPIWCKKMVYPLGAARATLLAPIVPPAPLTFSTNTVCPKDCPMGIASMRATTSVGPPAAKGTTKVIALLG